MGYLLRNQKIRFIQGFIITLIWLLLFLLGLEIGTNKDLVSQFGKLGLEAFVLFKQKKMALFFLFSLLLGGSLQLTNAYGDSFLQDATVFPVGELINNFSTIILSVSQISETLFILAIPFFMKRFGIKNVMLFSMLAWVLRFGLFGLADNSILGFVLIIGSCIIYGMAFDFFNISGAVVS